MDLFKSHGHKASRLATRSQNYTIAGSRRLYRACQPLDVSANRSFKDILKQTIDDPIDLAEKQSSPDSLSTKERQRKHLQSAASKMRVMMTQCMGEAWEQFNREKREVVVRGFRCLGISLPIDGSCDDEISIKGLDTTVLAEGLKHWERHLTLLIAQRRAPATIQRPTPATKMNFSPCSTQTQAHSLLALGVLIARTLAHASAPAPTASSAYSAFTADCSLSACSASSARARSLPVSSTCPLTLATQSQEVAPVCVRKQ